MIRCELTPRLLVATLTAVLVASCATPPAEEPAQAEEPPPPAAAGTAAPGPCDLLTVEEVQQLLELQVLAGVQDGAGCTYGHLPNEAGFSAAALTVRLEFTDGDPQTVLATYQSTLRSALGEYEPETINRLGDAAAWDGTAVVATVSVEPAGVAFISVQLIDAGLTPDAARELSRSLAMLAVAAVRPPSNR